MIAAATSGENGRNPGKPKGEFGINWLIEFPAPVRK